MGSGKAQEERGQGAEGRRVGRANPRLYFPLSFPLFLSFVSISFPSAVMGKQEIGCPGMTRRGWGRV